jgi:holo-[acyl-carrier protein] synthase
VKPPFFRPLAGWPACARAAEYDPPVPLRVGIDLVSVQTVQESISEHAERYLTRIYTDQELSDCRTDTGFDAERLAGRFAAKEAVIKVLRPQDEPVPWQSISVRRGESGAVDLDLSGPAAALAERAGVRELALSISHEGGCACAVVVAQLDDPRS